MSSIIAFPAAIKASATEEFAQRVLFRLIECEAALREAIEFAENVREVKITYADGAIINDHIAHLASVESPEEWRQ